MKGSTHMRFIVLTSLAIIVAVGVLVACNSKEVVISQLPSAPAQSPAPKQNPADSARRITAEELHKLWEKGDVLIIDTRGEPDYKAGHIPKAISIPANEMAAKVDELPRDKMIVAYCT
ncbi:MAG TPA: rhodanese-like domain-containing protein [Pyrinomonadaceae bacterium]|nr:rhodanese-like domain-containing protein [Pyrinomonadaceae bacterium]